MLFIIEFIFQSLHVYLCNLFFLTLILFFFKRIFFLFILNLVLIEFSTQCLHPFRGTKRTFFTTVIKMIIRIKVLNEICIYVKLLFRNNAIGNTAHSNIIINILTIVDNLISEYRNDFCAYWKQWKQPQWNKHQSLCI